MYLISYDLSNDRLRQKLAKELENYGQRVQYSVFECRISEKQLRTLYMKMATIMQEEKEGSVRVYSVCGNCEAKLQIIGIDPLEGTLTQEEEGLFIV